MIDYETFVRGLTVAIPSSRSKNAFAQFGGIPGKIMVDNLKSAVLKRIVGRQPVFNPRYLDVAKHCG